MLIIWMNKRIDEKEEGQIYEPIPKYLDFRIYQPSKKTATHGTYFKQSK